MRNDQKWPEWAIIKYHSIEGAAALERYIHHPCDTHLALFALFDSLCHSIIPHFIFPICRDYREFNDCPTYLCAGHDDPSPLSDLCPYIFLHLDGRLDTHAVLTSLWLVPFWTMTMNVFLLDEVITTTTTTSTPASSTSTFTTFITFIATLTSFLSQLYVDPSRASGILIRPYNLNLPTQLTKTTPSH